MGAQNELKTRLLARLEEEYYKILLVNFTTGIYYVSRPPLDEPYLQANPTNRIDDYFNWFSSSDLLHDEDRDAFRKFASTANAETSIIYRRKIGGEYHHVLMAFLKMPSYCDADRECLLYVIDVEKKYKAEYELVLDKIGTIDNFTGLYNKIALKRDLDKFDKDYVGYAFVDLNGLKYANDNYGHEKGDELILKLSNLLQIEFNNCRCYHISGDEFVVLSWGTPIREFLAQAIGFHKAMWNTEEYPIASIGYSVGPTNELDLIKEEAEREMYDDKRIFYCKFPKYKRK